MSVKKKIFNRKNYYMLLFALMGWMDWVRGSQTGGYWAMAVNAIGVIMAAFLLSWLPFRRESMGRDMIWLGISIPGGAVGYVLWYHDPHGIYPGQYLIGALDVVLLGLVLLHAWRDRKKLLRLSGFQKVLAGIWALMSLCMICSRYGEIWQGWFFLQFGIFFLVPLGKKDRKDLWDGLANGWILVFFAMQIWAYGFRPYDEVRYKGAYGNCNMNALFYLITYVMLLYRLHALRMKEVFTPEEAGKKSRRVFWKVFYYVLAGGMISFIFFTICRTALLVLAVITLVYGVGTVLVIRRESALRLITQWALIGICAIGTFPCVYVTIRYLPTILHHPVWFSGEYAVEKVHSFDPADSWKYVSLEEFLEEAVGRINYKGLLGISADAAELQDQQDTAQSREGTASQEAEEYLLSGADAQDSGKIRSTIWKLYLERLNLRGHKLTEGYFQITETYHAWHAQNIFIQIAFFYGLPAGVLFILLMAGLLLQALKLFRSSRESADILPLLCWILFIGFGMLECVWYPAQMVLFLIYVTPKAALDHGRD